MLEEAVSKAFSPCLFLDMICPRAEELCPKKKRTKKKKKDISDSVRMESDQQ